MRENLEQYVRRILQEKGLTFADVHRRAGGEISKGYVCDISHGSTASLTVRKLQALARGLDVPEDDLFAIARGVAADENGFSASRFATIFARYRELPEADRREVEVLLEALAREIEWRRWRQQAPERWFVTAPALAEWSREKCC
jgi:transcriptional regulator with XRE-family HTH domain